MFILEPQTAQDLEQLKQIAKRNVLATTVAIVFGFLSVVGWIGGIDGGFSTIGRWLGFVKPVEPIYIKPKVNLLGGSGWLKAYEYSCDFRNGKPFCNPYYGYSLVYLLFEDGTYRDFEKSDFQVGNSVWLKKKAKIFVNNYRFKGISDIDTPPYSDGNTLSENDITNMVLNNGEQLLIQKVARRKISETHREIWLKVSQIK